MSRITWTKASTNLRTIQPNLGQRLGKPYNNNNSTHLHRHLSTTAPNPLAGAPSSSTSPNTDTSTLAGLSSSSVNKDEIAFFSRLSSQWWNEHGEFGMLHKMNPVRVQFIRDKLLEIVREETQAPEEAELAEARASGGKALEGLEVLDVGCGGGLLSESLSRLGAQTLGIDASSSNIGIASTHASRDPAFLKPNALEYRNVSAEELLLEPKRFDVVCSMEVLEHVDNPATFLRSCAELVKPGGHLFLSTISRTPLAYFLTILAAEHILRLVSPNTHTYSKYVKPDELLNFFQKPLCSSTTTNDTNTTNTNDSNDSSSSGKAVGKPWISRLYNGVPSRVEAEVRGIIYVPWKGEWILAPRNAIGSTECNYMFWVRKPLD